VIPILNLAKIELVRHRICWLILCCLRH